MTDLSLLTVGFVLGLRHAADVDHLAAIATLATRRSAWIDALRHGAAWGCGHASTLVFVGGLLLIAGLRLPNAVQVVIEVIIGLMLIWLGLDVLLGFRAPPGPINDRLPTYRELRFEPAPPPRTSLMPGGSGQGSRRAALIGVIHGLASATTLAALAASADATTITRLGYLLLFGTGSIAGMTMLSVLIAAAIRWLAPASASRHVIRLAAATGVLNIALGLWLAGSALTG